MPRTLKNVPLLKLLSASMAQRDLAAERLCLVTGMDGATLRRLTDEGFLQAFIIMADDKPMFCVWAHITLDNVLHINGIAQLHSGGSQFSYLVTSIEQLAESVKVNAIRFCTRRQGLIDKAIDYGYTVESVVMEKRLR
jgi:hypothetical protein